MRSLPRKMKILNGKRCRAGVFLVMMVVIVGVVYVGYFCPDHVCALSSGSPTPQYKTPLEAYLKGEVLHQDFPESSLNRDYDFDIEGEDVLVFLHIQKTGGTTFGRHLVRNVQLSVPCKCVRGRKRCNCRNSQKKIWLFSRYSTGWVCGLHADWTELQDCVNSAMDKWEHGKRRRRYRYLYITILRDPVQRYLSEWKHVQRGSTWLAATLKCNGRQATMEEVPFCFTGNDWSGVTLEGFGSCPHNLANNRQSRMLANLSMVDCYNQSSMSEERRHQIILHSAKENLRNMAFFGLTEYQQATQYMFEKTFKLNFIEDFEQRNSTHATQIDITAEQRKHILDLNKLDIELYQFAKDLFFQRLKKMQEEDAKQNRSTFPESFPWKGPETSGGNVVRGKEKSQDKVSSGGPFMGLSGRPHQSGLPEGRRGDLPPQRLLRGPVEHSEGSRTISAQPFAGGASRVGPDPEQAWNVRGSDDLRLSGGKRSFRRRKKHKRKPKKVLDNIA